MCSVNNQRTETQSPNKGSAGSNRILQENTIFVENPTSSITIIINDSCSLTLNSLADNSDSSQNCAEFVQDEDAAGEAAHPELMTTTCTTTSAADNVPMDIAAGPDQSPVQPKMRFPATLKGNKQCSFCVEWYKWYHWLEYSRVRDAAYCYPC